MTTFDQRWEECGVTQAFLEEKAEWMSRDPRWPGVVVMYFRTAGSLMRLSAFDYTLISAAFFHAVIGLEGVLRMHYAADQSANFRSLLDQAVAEGIIVDAIFSNLRPLPKKFRRLIEWNGASYSENLTSLIPTLRNEYLHGGYRLSPTFLPLAIQVREAADAIPFARR